MAEKMITEKTFALKTPCVDCPFRKDNPVLHGSHRARQYVGYFTTPDIGATFPCHRSVPEHVDRAGWTRWHAGQVMCAGGLIFAEKIDQRSTMVKVMIAAGFHKPETLQDHDVVFDSVDEMVAAHAKAGR